MERIALAPADAALVERVLASSGVDRTPVPPESSYLGELARAARDALYQALLRGAEMLHVPQAWLIGAAAVLAGLALFLAVRSVLPRLRRRPPETAPARGEMAAAAGLSPALDAAGWRAELERRLAAGLAAEALEAVWWWTARSLAGPRAEPDWTSRDLVTRARRPGLVELIRRLDAYIYGPRRPTLADVRGLVGRLEEALS
jgi:hypothetical protein